MYVVVDVLVLLDFLGVVHDHVGLEVKLGCVEGQVLAFLHGGLQILLNLLVEVGVDGVVVKVFPLNALAGVDREHSSQNVLSHLRDGVDISGEP
jgi:hypothetical protein